MNSLRSGSRQAGLTILEVMIASLILAAILAITFSILASSSAHVEATQITLKLESDAREALNQIMKDLRESKFSLAKTGSLSDLKGGAASTLIAKDGTPYPGIQFRMPGLKTDLQAYSIDPDAIFTRKVSYYWELDNNELGGAANIDDDRNGLIDEGVLIKREVLVDGTGAELPIGSPKVTFTRICSYVKKAGLEFSAPVPSAGGTASTLSIKLSLEKPDPKNRKPPTFLSKTVESSVDLRN